MSKLRQHSAPRSFHPAVAAHLDTCFDCHRESAALKQFVDHYGSRLLLCQGCFSRRSDGQIAI